MMRATKSRVARALAADTSESPPGGLQTEHSTEREATPRRDNLTTAPQQRTPEPWYVYHDGEHGDYMLNPVDRKYQQIGAIYGDDDLGEGNAKFIVEAVNSHAEREALIVELVEALEKASEALADCYEIQSYTGTGQTKQDEALVICRAAITKARAP